MITRTLRDSVVYGLGAVFSRSLIVLQVPLFSAVLGPSDFGALDLLTLAIQLVNLVVALEISQGVAIYFAEARGLEDRRAYASTAWWFGLASYSLFIPLCWLWSGAISGALLSSPDRLSLIRLFAVTAAMQGLFLLTGNQLRWMLRASDYFAVNLLAGVTNLAASLFCVYVLRLGLHGVLAGQLAGAGLGSAAALWRGREVYALTFDRTKLGRLLAFSLPLVPSSVAVFFALYVDRVAINALLGLDAVGIYGVGYRVAAVVGVLIVGMSSAVTPLIYSRYTESTTPGDVARILCYYLAAALGALLLLGLFARELVTLFSAPAYHAAHPLVPVIAGGLIGSNLYVFAPGLTIRKKTWIVASISLGTAALNLQLNFWWIGSFGIVGAAWATLCSGVLGFALWCVFGQRLYPIPYRWARMALGAALVAVLLALGTRLPAVSGGWLLAGKSLLLLTGLGGLALVLLKIGRDPSPGLGDDPG